MAANEKGPKDITPNPMDEAGKKAAPAETAPVESTAEAPAAGTEPVDANEAVKGSIMSTKGWFRIIELILAVAGLFGIYLGIKGQVFSPVPASLGALIISFSALIDVFILKKFGKDTEHVSTLSRFVFSGIMFLLAVLFLIELNSKIKMSMPVNKNFILAGLIMLVIMILIDSILYIRKHKEQVIADIYMLISFILAVISVVVFVYYYVVPSFVLAAAAVILLIMSLTKDPLKNDARFDIRVTAVSAIMVAVIAVLAYACSIFVVKPMDVTLYGKITPSYKFKPVNLSWSGDSWSFAFDLFDKKKKTGSLNIMNSLSMGITTLPPLKDSEVQDRAYSFKFGAMKPDKSKKASAEENLSENMRPVGDQTGISNDKLKLPEFMDMPVWNKKGNFLVFTAGSSQDGPRNIWGVSTQLSLYNKYSKDNKKVVEDEDGNTKTIMLSDEEMEASIEEGMTPDEKAVYRAKKNEAKYKRNEPVGKPKTLLADINVVVDKACKPLTHKTAWSPDAKKFVFSAPDGSGKYNIWTSDTTDQSIAQITKGDDKIMPLWSPAGDKILYVTKAESYPYIRVADMDGKNAHELNVERDKDLFPLWNSSESKVIYAKKGKIIIMNASATKGVELSKKTLTPSPYWLTEKRKQITLTFTESGRIWRIFTIDPNGKNTKKIFEEVCDNLTQPKWSYDGKYAVAGADYAAESALWRFDSDGKFKERLYTTKAGHEITETEWSPTSEKVAFIVKKKSIQSMWLDKETHMEELWAVNNDATEPVCIYSATGEIKHMSWDDQGKRIAFDETYHAPYFIPPVTNIKIVHAIGAENWTLLPYEFYGESPTWSGNGKSLAYISWSDFWFPSAGASRLWIAQLQ